MKNIKYLLVFIFAATLSLSCNSDDDSGSNPIIGTWGASQIDDGMEFSVKVTFNSNGNGTIVTGMTSDGKTFTETDNFTWSTNGNKLTFTISDDEPEIATYAISGNQLTLTDSDGDKSVFTRQ